MVKDDVKAKTITDAIKGADKTHIIEIRTFDVFIGKDLLAGEKSVANTVHMVPTEKTFTDAEIEDISAKIIDAVLKRTGGKLRT